MDDLFLKIIAGDIPSTKIYEDEYTYAFLDIRPINKGHTLVVPKKHSRNILDIDTPSLTHLMSSVQKVARAVKEATGADGITLVMNNEAGGGQDVFHTHMHIIPRFVSDHTFVAPHHTTYDEGEAVHLAEKIKTALT